MSTEIKIIKKIIVGSTVFFKNYKDFLSKDVDEYCILSSPISNIKGQFFLKKNKKDYILCPQLSKEEHIDLDLKAGDPLRIGKYLVPEFIEYVGLQIEDLQKLKPLYDKIQESHSYQKVIYDSYIQNGNFQLSKEQLDNSYKLYKKYRNL